MPNVRCQWAEMICAAVGKSGRLVAAFDVVQEDRVVQLHGALVDRRHPPGSLIGKSALETCRAICTVPFSTEQERLRGRTATEGHRLGIVQEGEHDVLRAVDAEEGADAGERRFHRRNRLLGRRQHLVELVDGLGHLADRGIRVDRSHVVVQVADDAVGRRRRSRSPHAAARGRTHRVAGSRCRPNDADQADRRIDDLARHLVDALGDHAHGSEVLADDRHELGGAPERLRRRLDRLRRGCGELVGDRLELVELAVGCGLLELRDRVASLLEVARAPTSRRRTATRPRIRRR